MRRICIWESVISSAGMWSQSVRASGVYVSLWPQLVVAHIKLRLTTVKTIAHLMFCLSWKENLRSPPLGSFLGGFPGRPRTLHLKAVFKLWLTVWLGGVSATTFLSEVFLDAIIQWNVKSKSEIRVIKFMLKNCIPMLSGCFVLDWAVWSLTFRISLLFL